jgi:hypothetical protein
MEIMAILMGLVMAVIGAAIGALIGALFLMLATKMVVKTSLGYGKAYKLTFVVYLVTMVIAAIAAIILGVDTSGSLFSASNIVSWVAGLAFGGWWYGNKINNAEGSPIGFGQGVIVALVIIAISIVIGLVLTGLLGGAAMMGVDAAATG